MKADLVVHFAGEAGLAERNAKHTAHATSPLGQRGTYAQAHDLASRCGKWPLAHDAAVAPSAETVAPARRCTMLEPSTVATMASESTNTSGGISSPPPVEAAGASGVAA